MPGAVCSLPVIYGMQSVHTIALFGLTPIIASRISGDRDLWSSLSVRRIVPIPFLISAFIAIVFFPFINFFADVCNGISLPSGYEYLESYLREAEEQSAELTDRLLETHSYAVLVLNLVVIGVLPAVCEELFFRGALQRCISQVAGWHVAIWVTAVFFSVIHFQFFAFFPRLVMGAALGYIYYYTGSLWSSIIAHFINNAVVVTVAFYEYNNGTEALSGLGVGATWYVGVISLVCGMAMFFVLRRFGGFLNQEK